MSSEGVFDVIIVGCGAAGIGAAIELKRLNPSVNYLILEGRDRVGGRAWTDRTTFGEEIPVDLGAHYLCHHGNERNSLLQFYRTSTKDRIEFDFPAERSEMAIFDGEDGTKIDDQLIEESQQLFEKIEKKVKAFNEKEDQSISQWIEKDLEEIQDDRLRQLVRLHWTFIEVHEGSDLSQLSSRSFQQGEGDLQELDLSLHQGFGSLIEQLASTNKLNIELNSSLTHLTIDHHGRVHLTIKDGREYRCRDVLLTIPLGCLKNRSVLFDPPLPSWKSEAIDRMGSSLLNKIYLQFSSPPTFGEKELRRLYVVRSRFQFYSCYPDASMLVLFVFGDEARRMEEQTDREIVEQIIASLRLISRRLSFPVRWLITRWGKDPFSLGSYSSFDRGNDRRLLEDLSRETHEGRVHWAGEHTNHQGPIGYVDSALQSGQREAKLIIGRSSRPIGNEKKD